MRTGVTPCLAISHSIDKGIIGACEADLGALVTMLLAFNITKQPVFMGNIEDLHNNQVTLAHCTVATRLVDDFQLLSHFETSKSVGIRGILKPEEKVTLVRLSNDFKKLFLATGEIVIGEAWSSEFCRTQFKIRLNRNAEILIDEPVSSHLILIRGDWSSEFEQVAKILGLRIV